jgi:ribosomal protein L35AE/L33A
MLSYELLVNAVWGKIPRFHGNHRTRTIRFSRKNAAFKILKQAVHILTIGFF